jgi:hypothetical protein
MNIKDRRTPELIADVESLQKIQKSNPQSSHEWRFASRELKPRFRELARRQKAGAL